MLSVIVSTITIIVVVTIGSLLYYQDGQTKKDNQTKMQGLVDQINDSHYNEYKFDKKQDQNIKNIDQNVTQVHDNIVKLQNNVKFIEKNALLKDDTKKAFSSDKADIVKLHANKAIIANNTTKNNIVIEGGRTTDGNNEGWSAINFNGFHDNGEKRINPDKSRFRLISDQRGASDALTVDQLNKNNKSHQYMMMADGSVGVNNNKLRFSNKWSGHPDNAKDQSEISNDASGFKKLMIVGNKASGEGIRKVGIWDHLDVHGNQGVDGWMKAKNTQGRNHVVAGNWAAWMRNNGDIHAGNNMNVQNKLFFKDSSMSTTPNKTNNSDPYYLEKITKSKDNSQLRMTINDGPAESLQIWGDSCREGNCAGPGAVRHTFGADGNAWSKNWQRSDKGFYIQNGNGWMRNDGASYVGDKMAVGINPDNMGPRKFQVNKATGDWQGLFSNPNGNRNVYLNHGAGYGMHINTNDNNGNRYGLRVLGGRNQENLTVFNDGQIRWKNRNGNFTHFNYPDGKNYIRNDTVIDGTLIQNGPINLSNKWRLGDTGDDWLRLNAPGSSGRNGYAGGFAAGKLWTAQGGLAGSDSRMKENIKDISDNESSKLLKLNPQSYNYKADEDKRGRYGFIAQEVEKIFPNIVKEGADGMKSLNYDDIIPLAVANIKSLKKTIPNDKTICIDGVCLTKEDIIKLKKL
jgi:hypothetical protein